MNTMKHMVGPDIKSPEKFSTLKIKINVKTDMLKP